jgi:uncharacterized protein
MPDVIVKPDSVTFWLRVKPRAQRDRLKRGSDGEMVLELHAPPVEGAANEACIGFMAKAAGTSKSSVTILAGSKSRRKLLKISGRSGEELKSRIESLARGPARRND